MAKKIEDTRNLLIEKMQKLRGYGGDKQVTLEYARSGEVHVHDKQTGEPIVVFTADEWSLLLASTEGPSGSKY